MRRSPLAAAVFILAACGRAPAPGPASRLQAALETISQRPPCDKAVALEWSYGFPVPDEVAGRFHVFFYPVTGAPPAEPKVFSPAAEALFDVAGQTQSCGALAGSPRELRGPRWPAAVEGLDMRGFTARSEALLAKTESLGTLYAVKKDSPEAKAAARDFFAAFDALAEPALRADYYRLNPVFWEWLRGAAGRSLVKP